MVAVVVAALNWRHVNLRQPKTIEPGFSSDEEGKNEVQNAISSISASKCARSFR